ncbi:MAG: glycosyltransferase family 4 protein [Prolixibacteraceae bacterium]|nr:glycosyltransferase family 4 protein [Prolixibacteraceae bacterium]
MKNILFIYTNYSPFVRTDYEILSSKFNVDKYKYKPVKGLKKNAFQFLNQFFFLVLNGWKYDGFFIWFADYHSFLPVLFSRIFRKKSFVVIGGYDIARIPELNYGVFISKIRSFVAFFSMKNCTQNLAVSKYVQRKVKWITKLDNTTLIYNCVTLNNNKGKDVEKDDLILTVGIIQKERTFCIKGIDTFIEVARKLPQYKFLIIGLNSEKLEHLLKNPPENLTIKNKISHSELIRHYQRAKIYCQLSRSESFGVALAEAMYFGCIPIVTNVGGLTEIINNVGLIIARDPDLIAKTIVRIMDGELIPEEGSVARINTIFHKNVRKEKLLEVINNS